MQITQILSYPIPNWLSTDGSEFEWLVSCSCYQQEPWEFPSPQTRNPLAVMKRVSSFFQKREQRAPFSLRAVTHTNILFLCLSQWPNSSSALLGDLSISPTTSNICEHFRVCFYLQLQKPVKTGDGRGKHLALPLTLHPHSKLSGQQGHLLQGRGVRGEPPSLAEKLWNVKAFCPGFCCIPHRGKPTKAGTLLAIRDERTWSERIWVLCFPINPA